MQTEDERDEQFSESEELVERVVHIARVSKVVKGGRHFAFRALVVVGDGKGRVGVGVGKAREVPVAIQKGSERAKRNMVQISMYGQTLPHDVLANYGAAQVLLKPASPGTGVIAGGGVRAVVEVAGIKDILSKSLGSANVFNVVMATWTGLQTMMNVSDRARLRGKTVADLLPPWRVVSDVR